MRGALPQLHLFPQPGEGNSYLLPLPFYALFTIKLLKMQTYNSTHVE